MSLSQDELDLSPDALAVAYDYCPIHRGLHAFEVVRPRLGAQSNDVRLPTGEVASHYLRSPLACATERPVDMHQVEATEASDRWSERLEVEEMIRNDASLVPVDTRLALLSETLVAFDSALEIPVDRMNRSIAKHLLYAVGAFATFFAGLLVTHFSIFTYASVLALTVALVTPFISKHVFSRRWRNSVMALVPSALGPLAVSSEQIESAVQRITPIPVRVSKRRTRRQIISLASTND